MFGLGLSLTVQDFARLRQHPRSVLLALVLQMLVLPACCRGADRADRVFSPFTP